MSFIGQCNNSCLNPCDDGLEELLDELLELEEDRLEELEEDELFVSGFKLMMNPTFFELTAIVIDDAPVAVDAFLSAEYLMPNVKYVDAADPTSPLYPAFHAGLLVAIEDAVNDSDATAQDSPNNTMTLFVAPGVKPAVAQVVDAVLFNWPTGVTPFVGDDEFTPVQAEIYP